MVVDASTGPLRSEYGILATTRTFDMEALVILDDV